MRACLVFSALLGAASWIAQVEAAACAEICYTTELTGFAPGGVPGCTCSGSAAGARTGAGGCNCGQCYEKAQGLIIGFAINTDGTCTYGTDCGNCELESSSSSNASTNATATPTAVPATSGSSSSLNDTSIDASASIDSPASASSYSSNSSSASGSSNSNSNQDKTGDNTGSESGSNTKDNGLSLWQIVLAICCSVLIFVVAVVSVFACYCKARSRLYEHEENHATYYNQHTQRTPTYQPWAGNGIAPPVASTSKSNIV